MISFANNKVVVSVALIALLASPVSSAMPGPGAAPEATRTHGIKPRPRGNSLVVEQQAHQAHVLKKAGPGVKIVQTPGISPQMAGRHINLPSNHPHAPQPSRFPTLAPKAPTAKPKATFAGRFQKAIQSVKSVFTRPSRRG